ncbi:5'-3' exonuclease [Mobilicoccus caccae]|uniref:5'-3' exonuclease n=1 Tax=Mobilicoccus caccae TaxID=1859295 RepID=A0ABQ6IS81_9MICO|nr:hypothetical protein GCM10025883_16290 [Mobilicoccus caccae]
MSPLMLLDTASLYFRAFYGVPDRSEPGEPPRNAITGLVDMMTTLVNAHRPSGLIACWDDDWRPAFRVAAVPTYKAHRVAEEAAHEGDGGGGIAEEVPEALNVQVPVIVELLASIGIPRIGHPGYEADDVIGTLTERAREVGRPVLVVTGDRDLFQLVDDAAGITVLYTARGGVRGADVVNEAFLQSAYGVGSGAAYADLALLRGDPSDGLPGVKGVGEKTAAKLMAQYGSVAALQAAIAAGNPRRGPSASACSSPVTTSTGPPPWSTWPATSPSRGRSTAESPNGSPTPAGWPTWCAPTDSPAFRACSRPSASRPSPADPPRRRRA